MTGIRCLVPDIPDADALLPWLRRIDQTRHYTNFGPLERELRTACATLLGIGPEHVATTSTGTSALALALQALSLAPGARVLVPSLTFPATAAAVDMAGYQPVLSDVDGDDWRLTPEIAEAAAGIDAVVPVATFGQPVPSVEWDRFVAQRGIPVVMDAAGAFTRQEMPARCTIVFSLHATKAFGIGEGGLVASHDAHLVREVDRLGNFGFRKGLVRTMSGNAKLSEYHAAVGLAQFARLDALRQRYADVLALYSRLLPGPGPRQAGPGAMVVETSDAGTAARRLGEAGIETRQWYQPPLHCHPAFADLPRTDGLDVTDRLHGRLLGLPFHNFLSAADVARICEAVRPFCEAAPEPAPRALMESRA